MVHSNTTGSTAGSLSCCTYWHFGSVQPAALAMVDLNVAEMAFNGVTTYSNCTEKSPTRR